MHAADMVLNLDNVERIMPGQAELTISYVSGRSDRIHLEVNFDEYKGRSAGLDVALNLALRKETEK